MALRLRPETRPLGVVLAPARQGSKVASRLDRELRRRSPHRLYTKGRLRLWQADEEPSAVVLRQKRAQQLYVVSWAVLLSARKIILALGFQDCCVSSRANCIAAKAPAGIVSRDWRRLHILATKNAAVHQARSLVSICTTDDGSSTDTRYAPRLQVWFSPQQVGARKSKAVTSFGRDAVSKKALASPSTLSLPVTYSLWLV